MSHFYASIQGNRGEATRCGSKGGGITGHVRGWNSGVQVYGGCEKDDDGNEIDVFNVYATSGSGYRGSNHMIAQIVGGKVRVMTDMDEIEV